MGKTADQVVRFLSDPQSYSPRPDCVSVHETHGAMVFLEGKNAWKIKKPVAFPYMDFSTLEKRRQVCLREFELNSPTAPELYFGVVPITRENESSLAIDGRGETVEWALHMRRFKQDALLISCVAKGQCNTDLLDKLAQVISAYHDGAPRVHGVNLEAKMRSIVEEVSKAFTLHADILAGLEIDHFTGLAQEQLAAAEYCLNMRAARGHVRRCHGDLHLRNILVLENMPVLFDALEFSEEFATTDVLYDLAFLLMDLDLHGERAGANNLLNRYLQISNKADDLFGLTALPLYLACRSAILAMVACDRISQLGSDDDSAIGELSGTARRHFKGATEYLKPDKTMLIAIGGFSGTGKSTLAAKLAGIVDSVIGAVHMRSDFERKAMFDVAETSKLAPEHYSDDVSERVYDTLFYKSRIVLKAGHTVIVDAVFSNASHRTMIEQVAKDLKCDFKGFWLTAPEEILMDRVLKRRGDVSDATPDVVHQQISQGTGLVSWDLVDASGTQDQAFEQARKGYLEMENVARGLD